jgi:threonine/homoserine efflux transporter RhtA
VALRLDQELKTTGTVAIAMVSIASAGATLSSREPPVNEEAAAPSA